MDFRKNIHLLFSLVILAVSLINFQLGTANMKKTTEVLNILQFGNEEPFEPFAIIEVVQQRYHFNKYSNYELDTLRILCDVFDTTETIRVLDYQTRQECGMGWCQRDSIINVNIQIIEQ